MTQHMLISIIIPHNNKEQTPPVLGSPAFANGNCELVIVTDSPALTDTAFLDSPAPVRIVPVRDERRGEWLNAGARAAQGEILLFLEARHHLPADALAAILRNFKLLPHTRGGNFHLHFESNSFFAGWLEHLVKWRRYGGHYGTDSGLFVQKTAFAALNGFQPQARFTDYDFVHRLEKLGPTLFLPETLSLPSPTPKQVLALLSV